MKLITFSTYREAQATILALDAKASSFNSYIYKGGYILITGMGPLNALSSLLLFPHAVEQIYQLGIAGSFIQECVFEIFPISTIELATTTAHARPPFDYKPQKVMAEGKSLLTCDAPVYDSELLIRYPSAKLVDMEGYAIAFGAALVKKPLKMWKVVSDTVGSSSHLAIKQRMSKLTQILAEFIKEELEQ